MAYFLPWLSLGTSAILAVACLILFLDGRGQRKALTAAREMIAVLQEQVTTQEAQIGDLMRAVAHLVPPSVRPPLRSPEPRSTTPSGIQRIWRDRIAVAEEAGQNVRHCCGERCSGPGGGTSLCDCPCDGCGRRTALFADTVRDALGKPSRTDPPAEPVVESSAGNARLPR